MFTVLLKQQLDHHIPAVTRFCNAFSNKHFQESRTILVCQADMLRLFLFRIFFFSFLLAFHFSACFHPVLHSSTSPLEKPHEYKEPGLGKQGLVEEDLEAELCPHRKPRTTSEAAAAFKTLAAIFLILFQPVCCCNFQKLTAQLHSFPSPPLPSTNLPLQTSKTTFPTITRTFCSERSCCSLVLPDLTGLTFCFLNFSYVNC